MTTTDGQLERGIAAARASRWKQAASELGSALAADPDAAPKWHFLYGEALEKTGDIAGAAREYGAAIARRKNVPPRWYFRYAGVLTLQKQWQDAAATYEAAIAGGGSELNAGWFFRLGHAYEHLGRWAEAAQAYGQGLALEPQTTEVEWRMLQREAREFPGRRLLLRFVRDAMDEIRSTAAASLASGEDRTEVIYSYWAQGYDAAPEVVQRCHRRLLERSSAPVLTLDEPAIRELVRLPDEIEARGIAPTHRTDLLRLELLARYGGSWLDATCLVTVDPAPALRELREPSGFFTFTKRKSTLASWRMSSTPDHYLVRMLRAALHAYWRRHDRIKHYFTLHYIFEALTELDEEFGARWQATPRVSFDKPLRLRWNFDQPYRPEEYQQLLEASFVHKLTYKYEPGESADGTVLAHLLATI